MANSSSTQKKPSTNKKPAIFFPIAAKKGFLQNCMREKRAMKKGKPNRYTKQRDFGTHAQERVRAQIKDTTYKVKTVGARATRLLLQSQGYLPKVHACPKCGSKLKPWGCFSDIMRPHYRCTKYTCRTKLHRLHNHPLFFHGPGMTPIWQQYAVYEALLGDVPYHQIRQQFNLSHSTLERYAVQLRRHIVPYVEKKQSDIEVGSTKLEEWEVDECTISHWPSGDASRPKQWTEYCGAIRRGSPQTLKIYRMECRKTKARAPGPGPIRKLEWAKIAERALQPLVRPIVMHTDSAKAYQLKLRNVFHTKVVHQKKKVNGVWIKPYFTKRVKLTIEKKKR
eukprot:4788948-Amphidinium_carterae.1